MYELYYIANLSSSGNLAYKQMAESNVDYFAFPLSLIDGVMTMESRLDRTQTEYIRITLAEESTIYAVIIHQFNDKLPCKYKLEFAYVELMDRNKCERSKQV